MSLSNQLLSNIKKQAQNLARIQTIKLSEAYEIISSVFYHCPNYQDLLKRLRDPSQRIKWFELAILNSSHDDAVLKKFRKLLPIFVTRLSSKVQSNTNLLGLTEQIYKIFDLPVPDDCYNSLFLNVNINDDWNVFLNNENSPYTVLENKIKINDICYRLLAISVFMPNHWPLKSPDYIDIAEEISPSVPNEFKLNNCETQLLQKAVYSYIQARLKNPDDDSLEFNYPPTELSKSEKNIENHIQQLLEITGLGQWNNSDNQPIPFSFNSEDMASNTYLIFGYPVGTDYSTYNNKWTMEPNKCPLNDSQVFLHHGFPFSLEWISVDPKTLKHSGDYNEYFSSIYSLCSQQLGFSPELEQQNELSQLAFIKPASIAQIRRELELMPHVDGNKEAWLIKVENSTLAEAIINKVFDKDLFVHESKYGSKKLICKLDASLYKPAHLALAIEVFDQHSNYYSNLILEMLPCTQDGKTSLFITISSSLLNTLEIITKEHLIKAMKNGLIHHVPKGTFSSIDDNVDKFCENLPKLSKKDSKMLDSIELPNDLFTNLFRFLEHSKDPQFERRFF